MIADFSDSAPRLLSHILNMANTHIPGNTHPRRAGRPRIPLPYPVPRCAQFCEDARQTHKYCGLLPVLLPPDRRIHTVPPAQLNTRLRHTVLLGLDGRACGTAPPLEIFQAAGAFEEGAEGGDQKKGMEIYLV